MWLVIKRAGAHRMLLRFLSVYLVCGLIVLCMEPGVTTYADALWFLWAVSLTVGLGDFTAVTIVGRLATIVCSLFALIATAIITGVIVDFFNESRMQQLDGSVTEFMDKLEHLDELDKDELKGISQRIKRLRK